MTSPAVVYPNDTHMCSPILYTVRLSHTCTRAPYLWESDEMCQAEAYTRYAHLQVTLRSADPKGLWLSVGPAEGEARAYVELLPTLTPTSV